MTLYTQITALGFLVNGEARLSFRPWKPQVLPCAVLCFPLSLFSATADTEGQKSSMNKQLKGIKKDATMGDSPRGQRGHTVRFLIYRKWIRLPTQRGETISGVACTLNKEEH